MHIKLETSATRSGKHGFAELEVPLDSAPQDINDIIKEDRFNVTLSVSKREVRTKTDGGKVIEFEQRTVNTADEAALVTILTSRNYSTNQWNGTCSNANYIGMTGVTLDFDDQLSLEGARQRFAPYNYILHTSSSHRVLKNGQVADRFRVILPFEPGGLRFCTIDQSYKVYDAVLKLNPEADPGCKDPGRKYFPHTNELGAEFILEVNNVGKYFEIDISGVPDKVVSTKVRTDYLPPVELNTKEELDRMMKFCPFMQWCLAKADKGLPEPLWYAMISNLCRFTGGRDLVHKISAADPVVGRYDFDETEDKIQRAFENSGPIGYETIVREGWPGVAPAAPLAPAGWAKIGRIQNRKPLFPREKNPDIYLEHDDWIAVESDGSKSATTFGSLKHRVKEDACTVSAVCPFCDTDGAKVRTNTFHFAYLHCDNCNCTYYQHPDSPELFAYNGDLLRVEMKGNKFISHEKLKSVNFRNGLEWDFACRVVMNDPKRRFIGDSFTINRIGSAEFDRLDFEMRANDNSVVFKFPAISADLQDNSLIDRFLDGMFQEHSGFIKNWMALYSYTNYISLPVIVLTGARSCGKNTFADLVGEIFPSLKGTWDGDKEQFNDFAVKKLVFVDENRNAEKPTQYTEIKRLTGSRTIKVNEKHVKQYYVQNNAKFIFATNDPRPIALHWREEPDSEKTNNFFIYSCPKLAQEVDMELFAKLKARLGHYVRTELKQRYDALVHAGISNSRYALETPITDLAKNLFGSSKSLIELEAEELAQYLVCGVDQIDTGEKYTKTIFFEPTKVADALYVQQQDLRELIQKLGFKGMTNYKAYITALQDQGVLSHKNDHRVSGQRLGYEILRQPSHYTTTVSGTLPANESRSSSGISAWDEIRQGRN